MLWDMPSDGKWTPDYASNFYKAVSERGIYVTNLAKACGADATMPSMRMARAYRPLMIEELRIVRPRIVIAMGALVSSVLSKAPVALEAVYRQFTEKRALPVEQIPDSDIPMLPCYFPIGRGNPIRANEMLASAWRVLPGQA